MCRDGYTFRFPLSGITPAGSALLLLVLLACTWSVPGLARAEIPEFDWGTAIALDSGVQDVGGSGGRTAEFDFLGDGLWRLVYVKGDDIWLVDGNDSGWGAPIAISDDPAASRAPSITSTGSLLHVVWEDERSGHPEIWTRRYDGTSWSAAACLSCDPLPSRKPAMDGFGPAEYAYVVWETEPESGLRYVEGRPFDSAESQWGPTEPVSQASGNATDPAIAVSSSPYDAGAIVVWADDRHGETEIYSRNRDFYSGPHWTDERRVTDLPGNCSHPRLAVDICCWDTPELAGFVVFENDGGTAIESWAAFYDWYMEWAPAFLLSADDGLASSSPRVAGVKFTPQSCFEADTNLSFVSWTDHLPGGIEQQFARYDFSSADLDDPAAFGDIVATGLAACTRSPDAPVLQSWLTSDGVLSARQGLEFNCREDVAEVAPYFYVAPGGGDNDVSLTDICRDAPVPDGFMQLGFHGGMESHFAIDPFQETEPGVVTNGDGIANFVFRGGGCVTDERGGNGFILVRCSPFFEPLGWYVQIKSPDIDGTCSVDEWDLQYVEDRVGTDDFCADLDGSGLVDELDVAMVLATLGDECERTTGAPDGGVDGAGGPYDPSGSARSQLRVMPNPGSDRFELRFPLRAGDRATLRIVDVVGRTVRELGTTETSQDVDVPLEWDGRDADGRAVAAGVYFADLRRASVGGSERATIIVAR